MAGIVDLVLLGGKDLIQGYQAQRRANRVRHLRFGHKLFKVFEKRSDKVTASFNKIQVSLPGAGPFLAGIFVGVDLLVYCDIFVDSFVFKGILQLLYLRGG